MYPATEFLAALLFACLFAQISATKRNRQNYAEITFGKTKVPLPFDLNQLATNEDDETDKKRLKSSPAKKKTSEFYKAKHRRLKERMKNDPELVQRIRQSKTKSDQKKKANMTEEEKQAHKEIISARNHQQYLRRKTIYGTQVIKQRREVDQIKEQMKIGQVSEKNRQKVEEYYLKKRKKDRDYETRRNQKQGSVAEVDDSYWPEKLSPAHYS